MNKEELLKKIDFEKSWLYECGIFGSDVDIAFHAIKKKVIEAFENEPKEGHWYNPISESGYFCTNCESNSDFMYPYCPHCGARMGGAE